ncbi:ATP-dependent nuclease [Priestia sp. JNUCC 25]
MRLVKVNILNYKSIKYQEVDVSELNCLVGQNNSGKSTILDAIQSFYGEKDLSDEDHYMGTKDQIEIELCFSHSFNKEEVSDFFYDLESYRPDSVIEEQSILVRRAETAELAVEKGYLKFILIRKYGHRNSKLHITFYGEKINFEKLKLYIPPLFVISAIRNPETEAKALKNSMFQQLLERILSGWEDSHQISIPTDQRKFSYKELKRLMLDNLKLMLNPIINKINTYFQSNLRTDSLSLNVQVNFTSETTTEYKIRTFLIDKNFPNKEIDILSCGTGLQNIMILSLLQTLLTFQSNINQSILLFEEPEVYLHPSLQRKMINALKDLSLNNQVFFTTHSPVIVSEVNQRNILHITKDKVSLQTNISNSYATEIINDLGIKPSDILNKNHIIFVEGKDDETLIKELIIKITNNPEILERQIGIFNVGGFDKMEFYASANVLVKDNVKSSYSIIVDSDGEEVKVRKRKILERCISNGVGLCEDSVFVLNEYAIESYFLNPILLANAFPDLEIKEIEELTDIYFQTYEKYHDVVMKKELTLIKENRPRVNKSKFKQYFKPKLMFYNDQNDITIQNALTLFEYKDEEKFKESRNKLVKHWTTFDNETSIKSLIKSNSLECLKESKFKEIIDILVYIIRKVQS